MFISKFNYNFRGKVLRLRVLTILLGGPLSSFSMMLLFFFLVFGVLPEIFHVELRFFGGGQKSLAFCHYTFRDNYALTILHSFIVTYFFFLESSEDLKRLFSCTSFQLAPVLSMRKLFYIFFELDFLFNFAFTFLKLFTST